MTTYQLLKNAANKFDWTWEVQLIIIDSFAHSSGFVNTVSPVDFALAALKYCSDMQLDEEALIKSLCFYRGMERNEGQTFAEYLEEVSKAFEEPEAAVKPEPVEEAGKVYKVKVLSHVTDEILQIMTEEHSKSDGSVVFRWMTPTKEDHIDVCFDVLAGEYNVLDIYAKKDNKPVTAGIPMSVAPEKGTKVTRRIFNKDILEITF